MKRAFDFSVAAIALILLSPLLLLVVILVRIFDGAPVFFSQERVGQGGRPFQILKFRTMRVNNHGPQITVSGDARITRTGRILRKSKIDELPQLWNVVKGDMSFVGPRPDVPYHVALYSETERQILDLVPGITGPASLIYSNESEILAKQPDPEKYYEAVLMPHKIQIHKKYAARANFFTDLRMIVSTVLHGLGFRISYLDRFR